MSEIINILIVEDHPLVVDGICGLISKHSGMQISGVAGSAKDCIDALSQASPDVILLDIMLPDANGLELIEDIRRLSPGSRILVLSTFNQRYYVETMLSKGALGYLLKNAGGDEIIEAIQTVNEGLPYLCSEVRRMVKNTDDQPVSLSPREIEVLKMIADGLTNKEIADKLFISPLTVDSHRKNMIIKLQAKNTASLIKAAVEDGIIQVAKS